MSITARFYLFTDEGVRRLSRRVMDGLRDDRDALPQFANTKQRLAVVTIENEDGIPIRIRDTSGRFLQFDGSGQIGDGLRDSVVTAMEAFGAASKESKHGAVVDLKPQLRRQAWERDNTWNLSKEDLDLIAADIWGGSQGEIKNERVAVPRRPPLTHEARWAIERIAEQLFRFDMWLEDLSEPALKGLAFEARRRARGSPSDTTWSGIAEAAEHLRAVKARHRHGKGKWFAVIEATTTPQVKSESTVIRSVAFAECASRSAAEDAARRLLAEHAKQFSACTSIEARLYCDLEWSPETDADYDWPIPEREKKVDEEDWS